MMASVGLLKIKFGNQIVCLRVWTTVALIITEVRDVWI